MRQTTSDLNSLQSDKTLETPEKDTRGLRLVDCLPGQHTLASQIEAMLRKSDNQPMLMAVRRIFNDLVRFIDCLHLMKPNLHHGRESLELMQIIHIDSLALLDFIERHAMQIKGISEPLHQVLDGMSFALRHELRRVFDDILAESSANEPAVVTQAKFTDAHRVLTNCMQQSIITVAQVFDPRLDGRQLFNNSKERLKQSLLLCKDLWIMINAVKRAEQNWNQQTLGEVRNRVQLFRQGSMHYLMYRDWGHFEALATQLEQSAHDHTENEPVLHQFLCYLETLLGQVQLRAVLKELKPNTFCNDDNDPDGARRRMSCDLAFELYMA